MRPVNRGEWPKDATETIAFADYSEARDDLIRRIGDYCSYCEVCLHGSIAVEHVRPKKPQPALEREWTNFLLACDHCNSIKSDDDVDRFPASYDIARFDAANHDVEHNMVVVLRGADASVSDM